MGRRESEKTKEGKNPQHLEKGLKGWKQTRRQE